MAGGHVAEGADPLARRALAEMQLAVGSLRARLPEASRAGSSAGTTPRAARRLTAASSGLYDEDTAVGYGGLWTPRPGSPASRGGDGLRSVTAGARRHMSRGDSLAPVYLTRWALVGAI